MRRTLTRAETTCSAKIQNKFANADSIEIKLALLGNQKLNFKAQKILLNTLPIRWLVAFLLNEGLHPEILSDIFLKLDSANIEFDLAKQYLSEVKYRNSDTQQRANTILLLL